MPLAYFPTQKQVWATYGLRYSRKRFGSCSRTSRAQVSAREGRSCMPGSPAVLAGVGPDGGEGPLQVVLEAASVPAEHEHVRRHAVVLTERRVREAVAPDVAELDLAQGDGAVRLPEGDELFRREEELDVPGEVACQGV